MISFNLYDKSINAITNFFKNPQKNFFFLLNLGIGVLIGIVLFSNLINYVFTNYYLYTTSLFIGLILGGTPTIVNQIKYTKKNIIVAIITFIAIIFLTITKLDTIYIIKNTYLDIIVFFLSGILEGVGTIIPGISSTALLMLIGIYSIYINTISNILNPNYLIPNIKFLIPFSLGLLLSFIIISIIMNYLFEHHKEKTFSFILGVSLGTIILLFLKVIPYINNIYNLIISIFLIIIGYIIIHKI